MESCKRIQALFSEYIDGALDAQQTALAQAHIAQCSACKQELEQLQALTRLLGAMKKDEPPKDFLEGVNARIKNRRSLDVVLRKILNSPQVKVPVTISVFALLLFIVAERVITPDYLMKHHSVTQHAESIGDQYSPGLAYKGKAVDQNLSHDKDNSLGSGDTTQVTAFGGYQAASKARDIVSMEKEQQQKLAVQNKPFVFESEPAAPAAKEDSLSNHNVFTVQNREDYAAATMPEVQKDTKVYTGGLISPQETSLETKREDLAKKKQNEMVVGTSETSSNKGIDYEKAIYQAKATSVAGVEKEKTVPTDTITISVSNVAETLEKVNNVLDKFGIVHSLVQTGQTTQTMAFTVTVPTAKCEVLVEELKKLSVENVAVSLSPVTQETCSLSIQIKKISGMEPTSADYNAVTVK